MRTVPPHIGYLHDYYYYLIKMKSLFSILAISTLVACDIAPAGNDKLAFVYEVVRHGARASSPDEPVDYFNVPAWELQPKGCANGIY